MSPSSTSPKSKRLLVFCDGTWCGRETSFQNSKSNIQMLAEKVGQINYLPQPTDKEANIVHPISPIQADVIAGYQEGIGLNKTFLEYLWDAATASTIGEECISVYEFIVRNYDDDTDIYLFGFSRGSFTVRCVAGMINNCGIIKSTPDAPHSPLSDAEIKTLCAEVYRTYRSPLDVDRPHSHRCDAAKQNSTRVWQEKRPVRLMVIADTVGELGIPRVNAGIGFDWPEFYDQKVSTVVQEVYHAPCLHDRLWIFQPCLAYNGPGQEEVKIHQRWYPGCHYDIGRQTFRFLRQAPSNQLEKILGAVPNKLSKTIYPNGVLADVILRWMLQSVKDTETNDNRTSNIIPNIGDKIDALGEQIAQADAMYTGSGDIYGDILSYAPAGSVFGVVMKYGSTAVSALNRLFPKLGDNIQDLLGIKVILRILAATRDRRIPGNAAEVYPYKQAEVVGGNRFTVHAKARIEDENREGTKRYPSQTFESFELWKRVFGV